uniref:Putative secreted protein n=1 Tax=Ixodes ricinus TaxID=34613 RepID=A0A6B0ULU6_IXORI
MLLMRVLARMGYQPVYAVFFFSVLHFCYNCDDIDGTQIPVHSDSNRARAFRRHHSEIKCRHYSNTGAASNLRVKRRSASPMCDDMLREGRLLTGSDYFGMAAGSYRSHGHHDRNNN